VVRPAVRAETRHGGLGAVSRTRRPIHRRLAGNTLQLLGFHSAVAKPELW
jgi:hypothetical protein